MKGPTRAQLVEREIRERLTPKEYRRLELLLTWTLRYVDEILKRKVPPKTLRAALRPRVQAPAADAETVAAFEAIAAIIRESDLAAESRERLTIIKPRPAKASINKDAR
jgi:histone H3/H4